MLGFCLVWTCAGSEGSLRTAGRKQSGSRRTQCPLTSNRGPAFVAINNICAYHVTIRKTRPITV